MLLWAASSLPLLLKVGGKEGANQNRQGWGKRLEVCPWVLPPPAGMPLIAEVKCSISCAEQDFQVIQPGRGRGRVVPGTGRGQLFGQTL